MEFAFYGILFKILHRPTMKSNVLLLCLLLGCTPENQNPTIEPIFPSKEEKLLNDVFIDIIGTDLYYKISESDLDKANSFLTEKEQIEYYHKHKEIDNSRLLIFTEDNFISNQFRRNQDPDIINLPPAYLMYIADALKRETQLIKQDSLQVILQKLSQPLKLSSVNLINTGRYELLNATLENKIKGHYKSYGFFNCSRVFINSTKKSACLYYEKRYADCNKCSTGVLVIFSKRFNKWHITKKIDIYVT